MVEIRIASWESRFGAWIIDIILIYALVAVIESAIPTLTGWSPQVFALALPVIAGLSVPFASNTVLLFLYWTIMEGTTGQSVGKMVLNLRLTDRTGDAAGIPKAALSAFGKAFLLPLDCLIGWFAMEKSGLRLFNRLSDTIVIRCDYTPPDGVTYIHEDD